MRSEESRLRHPAERPLFAAYAVLNLLLMAAGIFIVVQGSAWLSAHPVLAQYRGKIRVLAFAAVFGLPALTFLRNARHALVRGKSIAVSPRQFPQIHAIFQRHCEKLAIRPMPELYFSDTLAGAPARAYKSLERSYIVLSSKFLQPDLRPMLPVFAFWLGREIGCLRLKHASFLTEFLLAYVDRIPHLSNPLRRVFTYSEDRYGAFLAPEGLPGLIGLASGRLVLPEVNVSDYLGQAKVYGGFWAWLGSLSEREPVIADRIRALLDAGLLSAEVPSGDPPGRSRAAASGAR